MSIKQKILGWLYRTDCAAGIREWEATLIDAAEIALELSRIKAEQFATPGNVAMYWNWVVAEADEDRRKGLSPLIVIKDAARRHYSWYCLDTAGVVDPAELQRRSLLACRAAILKKIDSITNREYEALGCVVAEALGADNVFLTPPGNDKGIDFFATFNYRPDCHLFHGNSGRLRVVGQSKKFNSAVQDSVVAQLNDTIENIKRRSQKTKDLVPAWFYEASGPIAGWIAAHSGFQSGAVDTAKNHGIILSESLDYAEILALSPAISSQGTAQCGGLLASQIHNLFLRFP